MKSLVILILIGFTATMSANVTYGLWVPQSPEELFEQSETVFVGNVTSVNVLEFERSNTFHIQENGVTRIEVENYTQTLDEYTVTVEKFLKNPQASSTITMLEATVGGVPGRSVSIGGFELGDMVLFYVPKIDGTNQYSPESFEIPKQCDAKSVLEQPRIDGFNDFKMTQDGIEKNDNFVADKPIKFVYRKDMGTLEGKSFDVNTKISKLTGNDWETAIHKNIHTESKPCEWISAASWEFVPTGGRYYMWMETSEGNNTGSDSWSREFTVKEFDFPLKQFKSGISIDEIQCNDDLVLTQKYDGSPACVTESTKEKLVERGWTEPKNLPTPADSQKLLSFLEAGQVEEFNKLKSSLIMSSNPFLSLNGTNLQGLDLHGIDLTRVHIAGTDMQNSSLQGIVLDYKNIKDTNLQGADLTGADLSDTYLNNVNLQDANMKNTNLKNIHLADSNIDNANLMGADLSGVNFQGVSMIDTNFEGANMQGTNLSETDLGNLNFQDANMQFANLKYANLSNANLKNTNLSNANLENANLRGADLYGSDLSGAILKNANLLDANLADAKNLPISAEEAIQRGAIVN